MSTERTKPSTICRKCKKQVRVYPAGGQWCNAIYPVSHKDKSGVFCEGAYREVTDENIIWPNTER